MIRAVRHSFIFTAMLWVAVALLAAAGFSASVTRGYSVIESVFFSDPVPELSRLDRESTRRIAFALGVDEHSAIYSDLNDQNRRFLGKYNHYPITTLMHVLPAALLIVLAPLQFSRRIRSRYTAWHRWSGRVIVTVAIPVALSGLFFGLRVPFSGAVESSAIVVFGGLFVYALTRAVIAIRVRDVARHREWMIRMFAVAIGVSSVRLVGVALAVITRTGPEVWFGPSIWIGFAITVVAAEFWIRRTRRPPRAAMAHAAGGSG